MITVKTLIAIKESIKLSHVLRLVWSAGAGPVDKTYESLQKLEGSLFFILIIYSYAAGNLFKISNICQIQCGRHGESLAAPQLAYKIYIHVFVYCL